MIFKKQITANDLTNKALSIFEDAKQASSKAIELADQELEATRNRKQEAIKEYEQKLAELKSEEENITSDKNKSEKLLAKINEFLS